MIEAGEHTFTLAFGDTMTVIAGVGELEREGLLTELVAAMGPGREGVHLQVCSDAGNRFTIFRPIGGPTRVIDLDSSRDVTESFAVDGTVDLLGRAGFDSRSAQRQMRVTSADLGTRARDDHRVATLGALDQHRLWDVAKKVREREERLAAEAASIGSTVEDADTVGEIERRHREFEAAETEHERTRQTSFVLAASLTMLAVPLATVVSSAAAFVALAGSLGVGGFSFRTWRRMEVARRHEQEALEASGNSSYLAFHLHRVNQLMADDIKRKTLVGASEDHRAALLEWRVMAGEIPVDWAWSHRAEIRRASAGRRGATEAPGGDDSLGEVTAVLLARLARLRQIGPGGESFPAVIDDALRGVPEAAKPALLDRLQQASMRQQVIVLTDDDDVVAWARLAAPTGRVLLLEPSRRDDAASEHRGRRRRGGHKVA